MLVLQMILGLVYLAVPAVRPARARAPVRARGPAAAQAVAGAARRSRSRSGSCRSSRATSGRSASRCTSSPTCSWARSRGPTGGSPGCRSSRSAGCSTSSHHGQRRRHAGRPGRAGRDRPRADVGRVRQLDRARSTRKLAVPRRHHRRRRPRGPSSNVYSVGDLLILLGVFVLAARAPAARGSCRGASGARRRWRWPDRAARGARRRPRAGASSPPTRSRASDPGLAYVALPLLAYDRFGSAWAVVAVLLPDLLPGDRARAAASARSWTAGGWRTCALLGDGIRCLGLPGAAVRPSLAAMIGGAALAGVGTALFAPAALAGLPQLAPGDRRPAAMGLFGALDDLGLTARPGARRRAAACVPSTDGAAGAQRGLVRRQRAADRGDPRRARRGERSTAARSLLAEARAGIRELAGRPEVRALLGSSTAAVLCIGHDERRRGRPRARGARASAAPASRCS